MPTNFGTVNSSFTICVQKIGVLLVKNSITIRKLRSKGKTKKVTYSHTLGQMCVGKEESKQRKKCFILDNWNIGNVNDMF